ncbi:MAG: DUF1036 domain-containing protein [Pseudomonadota bacterium]
MAAVGIGYASIFSSAAHADLQVCNKTKSLIGVAVGYRDSNDWITEGWWRVPADVCTSIVEGDLTSRYFYLHAEDAETGGNWRGPVFMCTSNKQFKIKGLQDCFARGHTRAGFFEVDTGNQKNWQVRLTESNQANSETETQ